MNSGWPPEMVPFLHDILCVLTEPKANGFWVNDYTWTWEEDTREAEAVATWKRCDDHTWGVRARVMPEGFCAVTILRLMPREIPVMTFLINPGYGLDRRKCVLNRALDALMGELEG